MCSITLFAVMAVSHVAEYLTSFSFTSPAAVKEHLPAKLAGCPSPNAV